jgi:DNA modification methylase
MLRINKILHGDALERLKEIPMESVNMCVTSPPYYGLRSYDADGQIGLENTPNEFINRLVSVFCEVKRVIKKDGTLWIVINDSYSGIGCEGCKEKDMIGIPWMLAFALRDKGWYLRSDIIWHKPSSMPESVTDRCTRAYEHIFMLAKTKNYYFNADAIKEPAIYAGDDRGARGDRRRGTRMNSVSGRTGEYRNKRDVWSVTIKPQTSIHHAVYPIELVEPMILAGCPKDGIVLDPFMGSGTTAIAALMHQRNYLGIELNPEYVKLAETRIARSNPQYGMFD